MLGLRNDDVLLLMILCYILYIERLVIISLLIFPTDYNIKYDVLGLHYVCMIVVEMLVGSCKECPSSTPSVRHVHIWSYRSTMLPTRAQRIYS